MKKAIRRIVAILLCWLLSAWLTAALGIALLRWIWSTQTIVFATAFALATLFFRYGVQIRPLYVIGHELSHWLVAKLFGRYTSRLRIGWDAQGSVLVERANIWIVLAPYCLPFYALVWSLPTGICFWAGGAEPLQLAMVAGLALSYGYHCALTWWTIARNPSDLAVYGKALSYAFISAWNLGFALIIIELLSASGAGLLESVAAPLELLGAGLPGR